LERRFHSKGALAERRLHLVRTRSELTDAMPRFVTPISKRSCPPDGISHVTIVFL
jgi:hypothetical protein